jgi:hypothetical protein
MTDWRLDFDLCTNVENLTAMAERLPRGINVSIFTMFANDPMYGLLQPNFLGWKSTKTNGVHTCPIQLQLGST